MSETIYDHLVYLDREFVSAVYEFKTGDSPVTQISLTQREGFKASLPSFLSIDGGASESRSFSVSTIKMVSEIEKDLLSYPLFDLEKHKEESVSNICWFEGMLTFADQNFTKKKGQSDESQENIKYLTVENKDFEFFLLPGNSYFTNSLDRMFPLIGVALEKFELQVRCLMRVYPANTVHKELVSIPLLIQEQHNKAV